MTGSTEPGVPAPEVLTYLHMRSPDELRPAPPVQVDVEVLEQDRFSPLVRGLTIGIGTAHGWSSQQWSEERWEHYLAQPHLRHWVAAVAGAPSGLLSLHVQPDGDVEIDTFGLLPCRLGQGIGGHFLTLGARLAWAAAPLVSRVWLHTSTRDHPHALPNYERRGFRRYRVESRPAP